MCMPLGDYLKDFNTLYMSYCIRGFFIRLGGCSNPGSHALVASSHVVLQD